MLRRFIIACGVVLGLFVPPPADAAKLYIREYKSITSIGSLVAQIAPEPGTDQTPVDFSGGAVSSSAFAGTTKVIRIVCDASCSYSVTSSAGTATTNNALLPAGVIEYLGVPPGYFVNVRSNP